MIGYPSLDEEAIINIARVNKNGAKQSLSAIETLLAIAKEHGVLFYTCLKIDMSVKIAGFHFGVRRSPSKACRRGIAAYIKKQTHLLIFFKSIWT